MADGVVPTPPLRGAFEPADTKRCSHCLGQFLVRKDGMIRYHGPHPKPCPGGGKPPAVMHDPLGEDGWARGLIERAADV